MPRQVVKAMGTRSDIEGAVREQRDDYLDRLLKLIPAESVAVYLFLDGVLSSSLSGDTLRLLLWIVFWIVLAGNILYLQKINIKDWRQYVIMELAFVVWVISLGGPFALYSWYQPFMGSILLSLFTFLAAPYYEGIESG